MIGQTLGNYRIVAALGNGSMGHVFLAEHQRIARRVAIKVLNPDLTTNPQLVARFLDEARATSLIRHPGIVEVFDCDVDQQGRVFLVMEYLEGQTLAARLEGELRLPWPLACRLAGQIATALGAAHEKGIVHRDIKPENVFLPDAPATEDGLVVKVLDFGIAKLLSEDSGAPGRTIPGALLGTPHYMPPEQCAPSAPVDRRADIYALGCLLFRMISGRPPFAGGRVHEVIAAQTSRPPPPLGPVDPPTPRWLDALLARMLAKQPNDRPASMDEVARELDRANEKHAGPSALGRGFRRHHRLAWSIALAGGVLLAGGLWGAGSMRQAARARVPPAQRSGANAAGLASGIVQPIQPPVSPKLLTAPTTPAALAGLSAATSPVELPAPDAGPARTRATPAPSNVGRSTLPPPARGPLTRRPARPIVEMDGLVDL